MKDGVARRFLRCAEFNLAFAATLGYAAAFGRFALLLGEHRLTVLHFPHLSLTLIAATLQTYLAFSLAVGLAFSLLWGFRRGPEATRVSLLVQECFLVLALLLAAACAKKFFLGLLRGESAYFAFYATRWLKENAVIFLCFLLVVVLAIWLGHRSEKILGIFSVKWLACLIVFFGVLKASALNSQAMLENDLKRHNVPNVLLLTVDTLRADHLSSFGYVRETSPALDRLARESFVFRQAMAPWTKTNQSFAGLFTGKYCFATGIGDSVASSLPSHNLVLAEILKNAGYTTAAFVANANLSRYFNYHQGFDEYVEMWRRERGPARERQWDTAERVTRKSIDWLSRQRSRKFFLWVHYVDPHTPYNPPPPYDTMFVGDRHANRYEELALDKIKPQHRVGDSRDPDFYVARYDGEIRFVDSQIEILLAKLDELGLRDNTLLVFTSDHGESFVENGLIFDHGYYAYDNCAHVPLIIRYPERHLAGQSSNEVVSLVDVLPTILADANLPVPGGIHGESLSAIMTDIESTWARSLAVLIESDYQKAARAKRWKLIFADDPRGWPGAESSPFALFHLGTDPEEKINLIGMGHDEENALRTKLSGWFAQDYKDTSLGPARAPQDLDRETLEQLRSLGYVN
jgi:arylsulfatase A-like enzyme